MERLDEDLDLAALANAAGYSPFHIHRIFAAIMGESPSAFLRRIRLERAAMDLVASKKAVGEIGIDAGYSTPDVFARAFRQTFGVLPSVFRQRRYDYRIQSPNQIHYGQPVVIRLRIYGDVSMNTTIEERPLYHVIGLRHAGAYWTIGRTFGRVAQWAGQNGVSYTQAIGMYYDDPSKIEESKLRSEALLVIDQPMAAPDGMVAYTIPASRYLVGEHRGAYEGLGEAWMKLFGEELPKQDVTVINRPCFEFYLNDCTKVAVEELRTDLCIPIE